MATGYDSEMAKKLNLKSGMTVRVVAAPRDVDLSSLPTTDDEDADGVLVFVRTLAEVERLGETAIDAARQGKITWMAYPKARQLETDLNRDILWQAMRGRGIEANRQVSIDEVWSAMRFKAGE